MDSNPETVNTKALEIDDELGEYYAKRDNLTTGTCNPYRTRFGIHLQPS